MTACPQPPVPSWTPPVPPEHRVLAAMQALAGDRDVYQVPMAVLAQEVGVSVRQVQRLVRVLETHQQIQCLAYRTGGHARIPSYLLLRGDMKGDIRGDMKGDTRGDMKGDTRGDIRGDTRGDIRGDTRGDIRGELPLKGIQAEICSPVPPVPDPQGSLDPLSSQILNAKEKERTLRVPKKEKTPPPLVTLPPGFLTCWMAYPSLRRVNKKGCLTKWQVRQLEEQADAIHAHIAAMKQTDQWHRGVIPNFETYLNQARYEADLPPLGRAPSQNTARAFLETLTRQEGPV